MPNDSEPTPAQADDPHQWLEDVAGERQLAWVRRHNKISTSELEGRPQFAALNGQLKTILNSSERIPHVSKHGEFYYNFWRDARHVRGIWRRTTLEQYQLPEPAWDTVIDLDQLAASEQENWVWAGVACLYPQEERCLVSLSRGGGDACVVREYDVATRAFVSDGFILPEAKGGASWIDENTVFVSTDFGPGSMTSSGYPRIVKEWRRGTPLAEARTVYEAAADDLGVGAYQDVTPGHEAQFIERQVDFYSSELFLRDGASLVKVPKPDDANASTVRDQLIITLRSDWSVGDRTYPQGALLATDFQRFMKGGRNFEVLFTPTSTSSLDGVTATRSALLINVLDNVRNRLVEWRRIDGAWQRRAVDAPAFGTLETRALDPIGSDQYFLSVNDFLTPTTLYLASAGSDQRHPVKSLPAFFDAAPYTVQQYQATSPDGTKVPYFVIMGKDTRFDGRNPTVLYGYGGFEISLKPFYSGVTGQAWLDNGGVYVLANIRGGGEFGPRWHQAALKEQRQRAYDDFISVAQDLIARKLSSPRHLGIMGGSNGGLLVGAVLVQRPDLFKAVVCQVPLLDMRRYGKLLAGASWIGEYGDPDDPAQWAYIGKYSPYQNVAKDQRYPRVLFTTSTRDDRVHPGHARKMVAKMAQQGHDVLYWENTEGGHAGAANNDQQAQMWALTYTFLLNELK
ncbi:prolyl oligopeptidase family serine peptidase [Janthinobacterium agaricidamnosum]|uniref:Prolyl oligopeptidase family protein n=1 Tax=Janthinobacterium agaricidamnosum NBRC 102515 = DSM 9628 TaxID=1349767 RepID=W0V593_9BURK|nr:prolyl oligopeptidase family serine peptidase [Janthinobacterium agaricidamnosum]CDG82513.1 prolyl oligopeptidase family protein [Janthinobacterium agaricidamnosum NBRC 102515 = DSM 9628]